MKESEIVEISKNQNISKEQAIILVNQLKSSPHNMTEEEIIEGSKICRITNIPVILLRESQDLIQEIRDKIKFAEEINSEVNKTFTNKTENSFKPIISKELKIKTVTYSELRAVPGHNNNNSLSITCEVQEGQEPEEVLKYAKTWVNTKLCEKEISNFDLEIGKKLNYMAELNAEIKDLKKKKEVFEDYDKVLSTYNVINSLFVEVQDKLNDEIPPF